MVNKGRGGSSSGSESDYGSRGPRFDTRCRWKLGFSLSLLFPIFQSVVRPNQVPRGGATFQENESLAVQLEAKQA